jgi:dTDP-4-amino-4,6-dideoxygalactose transaminase
MIPHSRPSIGKKEETAVCHVIRSGMLAQGIEVAALETELANHLQVPYVVAVSSGSAALHLSLIALKIGPHHSVILPSYVCTALLNAVRHVGATPVVVDCDPTNNQICPSAIKQPASCDVIIAPHMFGKAANIPALKKLGLPIVEDCALSLGATLNGKPLGSLGNLSVFSFYATKVICGGEGGAIATSDPELAACVRDLRDYDGRNDAQARFNYKLTDLQAAIIRVQLTKLDGFIAKRRALGIQYTQALSHTSAQLPTFETGEFPFRYIIRHKIPAEILVDAFEKMGISARLPVFAPLHRYLHLSDQDYEGATLAHKYNLSLPLYPDLSEEEIEKILSVSRDML